MDINKTNNVLRLMLYGTDNKLDKKEFAFDVLIKRYDVLMCNGKPSSIIDHIWHNEIMCFCKSKTKKPKCILFSDCDLLQLSIINVFKELLEKYKDVSFVFTTDNIDKIDQSVVDRCCVLDVYENRETLFEFCESLIYNHLHKETKHKKHTKKGLRKLMMNQFKVIDENLVDGTIVSVQRINDDVIFSVSDETNFGIITKIEKIKKGKIRLYFANEDDDRRSSTLLDNEKLKKPITTEDGFKLVSGDTCFVVETSYNVLPYAMKTDDLTSTQQTNSLYFKMEINAMVDYNYNIPMFSINECTELLGGDKILITKMIKMIKLSNIKLYKKQLI